MLALKKLHARKGSRLHLIRIENCTTKLSTVDEGNPGLYAIRSTEEGRKGEKKRIDPLYYNLFLTSRRDPLLHRNIARDYNKCRSVLYILRNIA